MSNDLILVRFGELSTKGKNINMFIKRLGQDIKEKLHTFKTLTYDIEHDHIYIHINDESFDQIAKRLKNVPGIGSFSLVKYVAEDLESIKNECLSVAKSSSAKTFKIITKRIDKLFPFHSDEINRSIAGLLLSQTKLKVDVHNPECLVLRKNFE